ncbi:MAG: aldehyde dehydrogenase family protein [Alphaproteobacteria bacterium]
MNIAPLLRDLHVDLKPYRGKDLTARSPIDGSILATLKADGKADVLHKVKQATAAFAAWRTVPAPRRGELVRLFGEVLRDNKETLAHLVTTECGKIIAEGRGEVQEMIDICDFAVGISRQLHGLTIASERPRHVMQESWHPIGPVAVISAFNFPVAVWAWNFALAIVCGDSVIWKPSEKTPLCALACQALFEEAVARYTRQGYTAPPHLSQLTLGNGAIGAQLVDHPAIALVSATGSSHMGQKVGVALAQRFGKALLELGGNNAIIVTPAADIRTALGAIAFGAIGTAGQRCTTTRRAFVHQSIFDHVFTALKKSYAQICANNIGAPMAKKTLVGPLIDQQSYAAMQKALQAAKKQGGTIHFGNRVLAEKYPDAYYAEPALVQMPKQTAIVRDETFAPILYVMPYTNLETALRDHNDVPQGLSSAIFTTDIREAEYFRATSDCGIANVNIGTSGAEIGGAFGGEKATGGGRESGSDAWKNYMRRQTSTVYYGTEPPALAQGVRFDIG